MEMNEIKHHQEMIDLHYTQIEIITAAKKGSLIGKKLLYKQIAIK
jgi:hypothetical protein